MFKVNKKDIATIATISVLEITKIKENMGMNWDHLRESVQIRSFEN